MWFPLQLLKSDEAKIHISTILLLFGAALLIVTQLAFSQEKNALVKTLSAMTRGMGITTFAAYFCYRCVAKPSFTMNRLSFSKKSPLLRRFAGLLSYSAVIAIFVQLFFDNNPMLLNSTWLAMVSATGFCAHYDGDLKDHPHRTMIYIGLVTSVVSCAILLFILAIEK